MRATVRPQLASRSTPPMPIRRSLLALVIGTVLLLAACGSSGGSDGSKTAAASGSSTTAADAALKGEITVSAAASLTDSFHDIGAAFEKAHPGTTVTFTFDSSGTLSQQILDGAPVDVFASADEANMKKLSDA